jgi:TonB family protein
MHWAVLLLMTASVDTADGGTAPSAVFGAAMTRPVPLTPLNRYPEWARGKELSGLIILKCVITVDGTIEGCEVIKSVPGLTEWAIENVTRTRFTPATFDGHPVRVSYIFRFDVKVRGRPQPRSGPVNWRPLLTPEMSSACKAANAEVCMDVALSFLHPDGGPAEPDRGGRLLGAACEGGLEDACRLLDQSFRPPRMITDVPLPPFRPSADVEGDVLCIVSSAGRAHDCRGADGPIAEWFLARIGEARFLPATFENRPFETEHDVHWVLRRRQ